MQDLFGLILVGIVIIAFCVETHVSPSEIAAKIKTLNWKNALIYTATFILIAYLSLIPIRAFGEWFIHLYDADRAYAELREQGRGVQDAAMNAGCGGLLILLAGAATIFGVLEGGGLWLIRRALKVKR